MGVPLSLLKYIKRLDQAEEELQSILEDEKKEEELGEGGLIEGL